jgi:hypothetical protein
MKQWPLSLNHPAIRAIPPGERRILVRQTWRQLMRTRTFWMGALVHVAIFLAFSIALRIAIPTEWMSGYLRAGVVGGVAGAIGGWFWLRVCRTAHARAILARIGGYCLQCGYDLRASAGACPECGAPPPPPNGS